MDFVPYIEPLFPAMLMGITGVVGIWHWGHVMRGKPMRLVSQHDIWTIWHVMAEASQIPQFWTGDKDQNEATVRGAEWGTHSEIARTPTMQMTNLTAGSRTSCIFGFGTTLW